MAEAGCSGVFEVSPEECWDSLKKSKQAVLIDVRTEAEWAFVGIPDLSEIGHEMHCIEWQGYPQMTPNPQFADLVLEALDTATVSEIFFLCRSGARSLKAAHAVHETFHRRGQPVRCVNVAEGFEGDLSSLKHRGGLNGWKARGLPWAQS